MGPGNRMAMGVLVAMMAATTLAVSVSAQAGRTNDAIVPFKIQVPDAVLRDALGDVFSSVTEIGSGQTLIVLHAPTVRDLLAKECPFDLTAPSFAPGACAQTRLAKAAVLLRPLEGDAMELIVRRSFADYLWTWLADATAE